MTTELLECVEVEPESGRATASVLWLHGLGADGNDFVPILPHLGLPPSLAVRFVFPHARPIPVTINAGMVMRAWYDIRSLDLKNRHDEEGIRASETDTIRLVEREIERGIPAERIVLAGFSQGGAIALHTGLRYPERLAGILALSTYLVLPERLAEEASDANRETPIFQAHGTYDPMVQLERGSGARDALQAAGYAVDWHEYPMQHEVCLPEIQAVGTWLGERLAAPAE